MEVILLEKVNKLGDIGQIVNVKNGFARNFLFPNKIAIRATKENKEVFQICHSRGCKIGRFNI